MNKAPSRKTSAMILTVFAVMIFLSSTLCAICIYTSESDADDVPVYNTGNIVLKDDGGTFGDGWIEGTNYKYHHNQRTLEIYEGIYNVNTSGDAAIDVRYSSGEFTLLMHNRITINDASSGKCKYGYYSPNAVESTIFANGNNNVLEIAAFSVASIGVGDNIIFDGETNGFIFKSNGLITFLDQYQKNRALINYSCDMTCPTVAKDMEIQVYGRTFKTNSPLGNLRVYGGEVTVNSYIDTNLIMRGGKVNVNYTGDNFAAVVDISGYTLESGELNINTQADYGITARSDIYLGKSFYLTISSKMKASGNVIHYAEGAIKEGDESSTSLVIKYPISNPSEQIVKPAIENGDISIEYENRIAGQLVTITAMPNEGYFFMYWSDDDYGRIRTFSLILNDEDKVILPTPTFGTNNCKLTLTTKGSGTVTGAGTYTYGTEVKITATPSLGYQFKEWSDGNKLSERSFIIKDDVKLTAIFELKQFEVKLTAGKGGEVTGQGTYQIGTELTIEAIPDHGYVFKQWSNGSKDAKFTFIVTENLDLTATFEPVNYDVVLVAGEGGRTEGGGSFPYGTEITVKALPSLGYQFKEWSDGSRDSEHTITVSGDIELKAIFELKQFEVKLTAGDGGNVKGQGTYQIGTELTIEAMPYAGYMFEEWSNGSKDAKFTFIVTEDLDLTATFRQANCNVVLVAGEGGRTEGGGSFEFGTEITIKAFPSLGYQFKEWSDGSRDSEHTITVSGDIELKAIFELKQFEVKLTAGDGGNVKGEGTYQIGTELTIEAIPDHGYVFKEWSNGSKDAKFTFVITEDLDLTATFEPDTRTTASDNTMSYLFLTIIMFASMVGVIAVSLVMAKK